jgi:sterol desaturase/sphingolipid hydroxylase (fatty acid hydroxylase superfamily)
MQELLNITIGLLILGLVFLVVERLSPANPRQPKWRKGIRTDLLYWFFTPLATEAISRFALVLMLVPAAIVLGKTELEHTLLQGRGGVTQWPLPLQALAAFLIGDFIGYWVHRFFHRSRLWPYHAVHHSSTQVDWLSSVRLHPVNDALTRLAQASVILLLGFPAMVLVAYVPFITLYAILLHANVTWTFGPLRYVFASPAFHRWHHTTETEGLDKNFAGFFPVWDILFGTFYMPSGKQPAVFGILGNDVPEGIVGQLLYPFRRNKP